jgi:ribonuclease P protein component
VSSGAARPSSFPKEARLRRRSEFLSVQGSGRKVPADCLLALVQPNGGGSTRIGLTVSSKVGNSVVRNRIRRRLRELFRRRRAALPGGLDVVLVARTSAAEADFARLTRSFERIAADLSRGRPR